MNTKSSSERILFRSKIVLRLWLSMMILVLLSVGFMWVVQTTLFERNYVNSSIAEVQGRLEPITEDLKSEDLAGDDTLIRMISKSTNGKVVIMNTAGELISLYSYGHPVDMDTAENQSTVWHNIRESEEYQQILLGEKYKKIDRSSAGILSFEIGIPVTYDSNPAYVVLYHSLSELHRVLSMNRTQLIVLMIVLTIAAAILAAVLSRRFVKPIHIIKNTVDRLAKGELDAKPGLRLNDELGQLSNSVTELGTALQRVDVLRKEVIANVSHELRSPLALIIGYSEMVRDISWKDETRRNDNLNLIISESRRLSEMVSDIMDYSQFQAGYIQLKMDWYNLYEVVESETAHCSQSARKHDIEIQLNSIFTDIPIQMDALKISQVMRNLLYNAINHTGDGKTICVTVEKQGEDYRVSVANPGDPIPEEERAMIWERYHRSQHQGGRRQGTGLGLSLVSSILDAHDMTYGVDCEDGLTIFWFSCPQKLQSKQLKKNRSL